MGIEPTSEAWEASILPLYDARSTPNATKPAGLLQEFNGLAFHARVSRCIGRIGLAYRDLREFVAKLEKEGELRRISAEIDPVLEITEITDRVTRAGGPALLFERPKGSRVPLLINMLGSEHRMNLALEVSEHRRSGRAHPRISGHAVAAGICSTRSRCCRSLPNSAHFSRNR